jgi:transcription elongation factor Elf1
MANCPRCGKTYSDPPALSRTDNETEVCPMCGVGEALDAIENEMVPQSDWPIGRH